ncbi:MAG: peptidyl-tRNA hydrolase Pth2 [Candidatus Hadarchaeales archaeon]
MSVLRKKPVKGNKFKYKQVIAVRCDLEMSAGKLAAQVAHGAVGAAESARKTSRKWFDGWLKEGQKKVVVKVSGEKDLIDLKIRVERAGLPNELVRDAGLTEIPPGTATALAIGPAPSEILDEFTGDLPLL